VNSECGVLLRGKHCVLVPDIHCLHFRNNYPKFLRVDGGSDWVIIHRDFAKFAISDLEVPTQLRKMFTSILLPLEGFFHTVIVLNIDTKFWFMFLALIEY
jgi:hypothetical protein